MAKISPSSIKYNIVAEFVAEGPFQKPDVIGALFGQTEGLLGADMELRELQKEGKLGRIEVDLETVDGKTTGEITIPTALDKTESTIIAASLETIDKIGPTDAKITVKSIDDVRGSKRDYIMERAKQLLANIQNEGSDSTEMQNELRESTRIAKVVSYGPEGLAAGPDVETSHEVIVVEGRADVMNLLKYGIKNAVGMQGTRFPKSIATLSETKELTLFVDGDRGGKLIAQNVHDNAKLAYITSAPDGKEVEELAGKEILQALRKKVAVEEYFGSASKAAPKVKAIAEPEEEIVRREVTDDDITKLRELSEDLKGKNVLVLNEALEVLENVPASKLSRLVTKDAFVLMADSVSMILVKGAESLKAKAIAARTFGKVPETDVQMISL
jgi:DNA primase